MDRKEECTVRIIALITPAHDRVRRQRPPCLGEKCRITRRRYGNSRLTGGIAAKSAPSAVPRLAAGADSWDPGAGEHEIRMITMRSARAWPEFVGKYSDDDILEAGRVERPQAINIVFDGVELGQRRIGVHRRRRVTGCCRMDVGTGERVIKEAGGWEPRLDAAFARQSEVLEAGIVAIDGEFARQFRCLRDIEIVH